jgi:hypothetical protein
MKFIEWLIIGYCILILVNLVMIRNDMVGIKKQVDMIERNTYQQPTDITWYDMGVK